MRHEGAQYLFGPQYVEQFDPLHEAFRDVFIWEIEALNTNGKFLLFLSFFQRIVSHPEVVGGLIALALHH